MLELCVWILLILLGYIGLSAAVERLLFHATRRSADETSLRQVLHLWRTERRVSMPECAPLGWLTRCIRRAKAEGNTLLNLCLVERLQIIRFTNLLPMVADVATGAGLLAAVIALSKTASASEHTVVIALGMHATIAGLLIAIPIKLFLGLFTDRTDRLVSQAETVIETLETILFQPPPAPSIVSNPPTKPRTPTASAHCETPTASMKNGPFRRRTKDRQQVAESGRDYGRSCDCVSEAGPKAEPQDATPQGDDETLVFSEAS